MNIEIRQLTDMNDKYFNDVNNWQVDWWGIDYKNEKVIEKMSRCLNENIIPQTYIAILDNEAVGMYQIDMSDDVDIRPDYYPWVANVYVDEKYRGQGICSALMKHANEIFKKLGLDRVYLHTKHINLYEKYGWKYLEEVETLKGKIRKIYYLDIEK